MTLNSHLLGDDALISIHQEMTLNSHLLGDDTLISIPQEMALSSAATRDDALIRVYLEPPRVAPEGVLNTAPFSPVEYPAGIESWGEPCGAHNTSRWPPQMVGGQHVGTPSALLAPFLGKYQQVSSARGSNPSVRLVRPL
jgi:hypothetical protein